LKKAGHVPAFFMRQNRKMIRGANHKKDTGGVFFAHVDREDESSKLTIPQSFCAQPWHNFSAVAFPAAFSVNG
jgi:hypothetical protein